MSNKIQTIRDKVVVELDYYQTQVALAAELLGLLDEHETCRRTVDLLEALHIGE